MVFPCISKNEYISNPQISSRVCNKRVGKKKKKSSNIFLEYLHVQKVAQTMRELKIKAIVKVDSCTRFSKNITENKSISKIKITSQAHKEKNLLPY